MTGGGLAVKTGPTTTSTLNDSTAIVEVTGTVDVNLDGFVQLTGVPLALLDTTEPTLTLFNGTTTSTLTNPQVLTFGIGTGTGFVGINGGTAQAAGFTVAVSSLAVAVVKPSDPLDTRGWLTVNGSASDASFVAPGGVPLSMSATTLSLDLNTTASDGTFVDYATTPLTVPTGPSTSVTLSDSKAIISASGTLNVNLGNFVTLTNVNFAFSKTTLASVGVTAGTTIDTLTNAQVLTFGLSGASGFVGIDGGTSQAVGFSVTFQSLAFALIQPADSTDTRSWITIAATSSNASFQGPSGLPITVAATNLTLDMNTEASDGTWVNYSTLPNNALTVATGPSTSVNLTDTTSYTRVLGTVNVNLDGYAQLTNVNFALYDSTLPTVNVTNGTTTTTLTDASLLTFGLSGGAGSSGSTAGPRRRSDSARR